MSDEPPNAAILRRIADVCVELAVADTLYRRALPSPGRAVHDASTARALEAVRQLLRGVADSVSGCTATLQP